MAGFLNPPPNLEHNETFLQQFNYICFFLQNWGDVKGDDLVQKTSLGPSHLVHFSNFCRPQLHV